MEEFKRESAKWKTLGKPALLYSEIEVIMICNIPTTTLWYDT